eukprot:SAG22_NODE_7709_length_716_cov_0.471637_1_plen_95_part_00
MHSCIISQPAWLGDALEGLAQDLDLGRDLVGLGGGGVEAGPELGPEGGPLVLVGVERDLNQQVPHQLGLGQHQVEALVLPRDDQQLEPAGQPAA